MLSENDAIPLFRGPFYFEVCMSWLLAARGGGFGGLISFFIRVVIYDICITGISDVLGVPRMVALFIFLGILVGISFIGYLIKQKVSPGVDSD
jgi:hypothetical protein